MPNRYTGPQLDKIQRQARCMSENVHINNIPPNSRNNRRCQNNVNAPSSAPPSPPPPPVPPTPKEQPPQTTPEENTQRNDMDIIFPLIMVLLTDANSQNNMMLVMSLLYIMM